MREEAGPEADPQPESQVTSDVTNENPAPGQLADERDVDGWDREQHGKMQDYATADDAVKTERHQPGDSG